VRNRFVLAEVGRRLRLSVGDDIPGSAAAAGMIQRRETASDFLGFKVLAPRIDAVLFIYFF
jgi:hypothetical protein